MRQLSTFPYWVPKKVTRVNRFFFGKVINSRSFNLSVTSAFLLLGLIITTNVSAQIVFPPTTINCPSNDLEVIRAILPAPANDPCNCTGTRTLQLGIINKTGSFRTAFAMWGKLIRKDANGNQVGSPVDIFACASGIFPDSTAYYPTNITIPVNCGQSIEIIDVVLAWTSANKKENCDYLFNNPTGISPKCGRPGMIRVETGVEGIFDVSSATCTAQGSIKVSPFGGIAPYKVKIGTDERTGIPAGGSTTFDLPAGAYDILITDSRPCSVTRSRTVGSSSAPTANAGVGFTKTCTTNASGGQIGGEAAVSGFSYSWTSSPAGFTSTSAQPTVDPSVTTTYTLTKTNTSTGCSGTAAVIVTVDISTPTASAGSDVLVNCTTPSATLTATGGTSYLWSTGATTASITVTPSATTTYTVTVKGANGCTATDDVMVTVDKATPTANAGSDVTVNCTTPSATLTASGGTSYLWSTGATTASITVTPSATTTYTVMVKGANGCTATDDVMVTVDKATPTANAGSDVTVNCTTPSATLTATGGTSYLWSTGATTASITATPSATTTYTVTVKGANGCTATDDLVVTVDKATPTASAGSDVTVNCTTPSATLIASGGTSYLWSTGATTASITVTPSATTTYTVTVKGANGCTATDDVIVTVDEATPTASAGSDVTVNCTTPSATLTASGGTSYLWSTGATTASITVTPSATTTYTVTVKGANGCTATDDVIVTVDKALPPTPTICVVEPSLCGPTTGSVTILSPLDDANNDYEYRMNGGTWQDATSFTDLAPGSLGGNATGFEVRLKSSGCVSLPAKTCGSPCNSLKSVATSATEKTNEEPVIKTPVSSGPKEIVSSKGMEMITARLESGTTVTAYPNPFSDKIRFVLNSGVSGRGTLELYNMMGQKLKTVFEGFIEAGKTRLIEYNVPYSQRSNVVFVFKVGDQQFSGKLTGLR